MLSVEHVTKKYETFTALKDISLTFTSGVYGLLAPNGAGKTTKMLTILLFPTRGHILWEGEDIQTLGAEYRGQLVYLPQQFGYYPNYMPRQFLRYAAALQCLHGQRPRTGISKAQLYEAAWAEEYLHGTNSVENTIWRLRKKLEEDPQHPAYIKTVIGTGYKVDEPTKY